MLKIIGIIIVVMWLVLVDHDAGSAAIFAALMSIEMDLENICNKVNNK